MVSEEQFYNPECDLPEGCSLINGYKRLSLNLTKEVKRLEAEANWLANALDAHKICIGNKLERCWHESGEEDCRMCWREEARKAVR